MWVIATDNRLRQSSEVEMFKKKLILPLGLLTFDWLINCCRACIHNIIIIIIIVSWYNLYLRAILSNVYDKCLSLTHSDTSNE